MIQLDLKCPVCLMDFSKFKGIETQKTITCPKCMSSLQRRDSAHGMSFVLRGAQGRSPVVKMYPNGDPSPKTSESWPWGSFVVVGGAIATGMATPSVRGPEFLLAFGICLLVLWVYNRISINKYGYGEVLWPLAFALVIPAVRIFVGSQNGMHKFDLLFVETIFAIVATWPFQPSSGGSGIGNCSSGSSCSSSSCGGGGGCGGGGCGGCGS